MATRPMIKRTKKPATYEERIVSFIDIMGFAKEVMASDNTTLPAIEKKVQLFRDSFHSKSYHPKDEPGLLVLSFSDSMLRARKIEWSPLFQEILSAVHGIAQIVVNGHLVRGALTHGHFYFDKKDNVLISPAFINAYNGEHSLASVPRVIVDPRTLEEFKKRKDWWKDCHSYEQEAEYVYQLLRLDTDGFYFVDYLKAIYNELDSPNDDYPGYMADHKAVIEKALGDKLPLEVRKKYVWLGNYHNQVRTEFGDGKGTEFEGWLDGTEISAKILKL